MNGQKQFSVQGPDPTTLDGVREEIDYWTKESARQQGWFNESRVGSQVKARLAHLKNLERRLTEQKETTRVQRWLDWLKNHAVISVLVFLAILLIGLQQFLSALGFAAHWIRLIWHHLVRSG